MPPPGAPPPPPHGAPPPAVAPPGPVQPHRGVLILVLGILGLVVCVICGIIAWIFGNNDLEQMRAGRMDPTGEGLTVAGRICGIISVALAAMGVVVVILMAIFGALGGLIGVS